MIEITYGTPENLIIALAHGKVTGDDYEKAFIPAIEAKLKTHKKIRLLYQLGEDFHGFTALAMWDDAKLSLGHLGAFEAVAVVTDVLWITDAVKFLGLFLHCPVQVFGNDKLAEARDWVATVPAWRSLHETDPAPV
jgi:hypothetical protein